MDHWSRRLDQAMIHFIGICWSYGTYGYNHWKCFVFALILNVDSMLRLFQKTVRSRRILCRMAFAFTIPILPFLQDTERVLVFGQLVLIYSISVWLFSKYPFGGWSHGFFHLLITCSNPIMMNTVTAMMERDGFIDVAARCAVIAADTGGDDGTGGGGGIIGDVVGGIVGDTTADVVDSAVLSMIGSA